MTEQPKLVIMRKKILLVYPQLGNTFWFGVMEPLALEIFSSIAKEEGHEVTLVDMRFDRNALKRLKRQGYCPDVIGATTHGYTEVAIVSSLSARLKELWPKTVLIVGGIPATLAPEAYDQRHIDVLAQGPGEGLWRKWCREGFPEPGPCRQMRDEKPARCFSFPVPDRASTECHRRHYRTYVPHHRGKKWFGPCGFTMLTQGCPFRCTFCVIWPANHGLYRRRNIPEIIKELQSMKQEYVYFGDDNSFVDDKFANELADAIEAAGIRKKYLSYSRADHICDHTETLRRWHKLGLRHLVIGVEAIDDSTLKDVNKSCEHDTNEKALRILDEIGIKPVPHLLLTPDMDREDFRRMESYIYEHSFEYPTMVPLTPLPGTGTYDQYRDRLVTRDLSFYNFMYMVVEPTKMTLKQWHAEMDRLYCRVWSWRRYFSGKAGDCGLFPFLKWWVYTRVVKLAILSKRRALYRDAAQWRAGQTDCEDD